MNIIRTLRVIAGQLAGFAVVNVPLWLSGLHVPDEYSVPIGVFIGAILNGWAAGSRSSDEPTRGAAAVVEKLI